jgi:hypothetical protein
MTPTCPDHKNAMGNTLGQCLACQREAAQADHHAGIAAVRAQLAKAPRPATPQPKPEPVRDLARARARADRQGGTQ